MFWDRYFTTFAKVGYIIYLLTDHIKTIFATIHTFGKNIFLSNKYPGA